MCGAKIQQINYICVKAEPVCTPSYVSNADVHICWPEVLVRSDLKSTSSTCQLQGSILRDDHKAKHSTSRTVVRATVLLRCRRTSPTNQKSTAEQKQYYANVHGFLAR